MSEIFFGLKKMKNLRKNKEITQSILKEIDNAALKYSTSETSKIEEN